MATAPNHPAPITQPHCSATSGAIEGSAALLRTPTPTAASAAWQPQPPPCASPRHGHAHAHAHAHVRALGPQAYHIRHVLGAAAATRFTRHAGHDFRLAR